MPGLRVALLVATDRYRDTGLSRLAAPASDATRLADVLADAGIAGFRVETLYNRPHHVVGKEIGSFYRDRRRDDLTLLYFTGHGIKDDDGHLYLAMTDTERDNLRFTGVAGEQIRAAMQGCRSRQNVLVLDCCYAGAFPAGAGVKADAAVHAHEQLGGRGCAVLTSSDATQYSFEGSQLTGAGSPSSLFTRFLIDGLRTGRADLDGDGDITLDELYSYVHDRVIEEQPQQRPKIKADVEGRILFARNIRWAIPAHLSNTISSPYALTRLTALRELRTCYNNGNAIVQQRVLDQVRLLANDDDKSVSDAASQFMVDLPHETGPLAAAEQGRREDRHGEAEPLSPLGDEVTSTPPLPERALGREPPLAQSHIPPPRAPRKLAAVWVTLGIGVIGLLAAIGGVYSTLSAPRAHVLWTYNTGAVAYNVPSPAVARGTVYIGSADNVYALNAATGQLRWTHATDSTVTDSAVAGDTVYIGSADSVYALNAATGHPRWTHATESGVTDSAVAGDTVYIGSDNGDVYALNAATAHLRWTQATGGTGVTGTAVAGDTVYTGSDGYVYALNAATGHIRWTQATGGSGSVIAGTAVAGDTVYIGTVNARGDYGNDVYALNAATGHIRWAHATGGSGAYVPAVAGDTVYIGSNDGYLNALNAATGHRRWTQATDHPTAPAVAGGTVYTGSGGETGNIYALDATTGHIRWTYDAGHDSYSAPAIADGAIYIGCVDGYLYAIRS